MSQGATFRAGLIQMRSGLEPHANLDAAARLIEEAKSGGADYVQTPEMTNILALERDIARATRAERINILAPIPGKDTVGIEIANSKKQKVTLRELFESDDFSSSKAKIPIALGKDVYGKTIIGDLAGMPHGLVAGTTGSGKSVCINAIIASILYKFTP